MIFSTQNKNRTRFLAPTIDFAPGQASLTKRKGF